MQCDMCGKDTELMVALVEGTELRVCSTCSRYGKVLRRALPPVKDVKIEKPKPKIQEKEIIEVITEDYARRMREAREKMGLTQEDFAKKLNEKEAIIHKMEIGKFEPSISLARKLEKALNITLVEEHEEEHGEKGKIQSDVFTIGDIIKVKK